MGPLKYMMFRARLIRIDNFADADSWVIVCSDGLCGNIVRGAGGGLDNQEIVDLVLKGGKAQTAKSVAEKLSIAAQEAGSTDDVTVLALRLK